MCGQNGQNHQNEGTDENASNNSTCAELTIVMKCVLIRLPKFGQHLYLQLRSRRTLMNAKDVPLIIEGHYLTLLEANKKKSGITFNDYRCR